MVDLINKIASDEIIDQAYQWLCKQRQNVSHNNDVWEFRSQWPYNKQRLHEALLSGEYQFSPLVELCFPEGNIECWCAADALVLKAMTIVLGEHLASFFAPTCVHVAGHGGAKKAVRDVFNRLSPNSHVMKSDIKRYYASIDHMLLINTLSELITDKYVLRLLWQYLKRSVCYGGNYREVTRGISLGCPLSPLIAALFLKPLDDVMKDSGFFYVRFMDDWVVIAPSRWKLRKVVKQANRILNGLQLEKHPEKTFIGRAKRGFSFLGYYLTPWAISVAQATVNNMKQRIARLYEQGADAFSIGQYVIRWMRWVRGGKLNGLVLLDSRWLFRVDCYFFRFPGCEI